MDSQLAKTIGDVARQARTALHLTQEDAAERVGISLEFYARIERGGTLPSVPTLLRLANALGVTADALLGRTKPGPILISEPPTTFGLEDENPELRRLIRRLRRARPRTLRLLTQIATEVEGPRSRGKR